MSLIAGILICFVVWIIKETYGAFTNQINYHEFTPFVHDKYGNIWILENHPASQYWIRFFTDKCKYNDINIVSGEKTLSHLFPTNSLNGTAPFTCMNDGTGMANMNQFEVSVYSSMTVEEQDAMWNMYLDKTRW